MSSYISWKKIKLRETARKEELFTQQNVKSTKSCILDIQENNFQSAFLNIVAKSNNRSGNGKLAKHFHKNHNINNNLNVTILQNNIKTTAA